MPKKVKKGGEGGAKTEEERMLYLQQRAQAEEEMAKKKEEILVLFLREKLQKEERNTAVNLLKLNDSWRSVLRQIRIAELSNDIGVLTQTFERRMDGMNDLIKKQEQNLQEAERQSAQARRVHLQHVDHLSAREDKWVGLIQQQWDSCLEKFNATLACEREEMLANSLEHKAKLDDVMFALEQKHKEGLEETSRMFGNLMEESELDKSAKIHELLEAARKGEAAKMSQFQSEEDLYSTETQESDDEMVPQKADEALIQVEKLQGEVTKMRVKISSLQEKSELVEQSLNAARNLMSQNIQKLQQQLTDPHSGLKKQIADLSIHSHDAIEKLRAVVAQGERVLCDGEMRDHLSGEQQDAAALPLQEHGLEMQDAAKETVAFLELQQLMRCVNGGVLRRETLKQRRQEMSRENLQLRLLLQQHLGAMTVGDHSFNGLHPLLAVCPAPAARDPQSSNRRHTVIEVAHGGQRSL